ncbi:TPA: Abi family protein [Staphylococcus aureus]|nr:Abi family protein [Staphylococcus aureus]
MKPFENHNKQLKILRRRGIEVPSSAKRDLENENYYNIINGYKDLFLELDVNGNFLVPDKYKQGTHFKEVFSLYKLDRKFRNVLLEYLLVFETHIKSRISYYFSEKYREPHSYLYFKNYSSDTSKTDSIVKMVATFSSVMSNRKNKPLKHYINTHNGVPLWILVNYLTLGNVSKMYSNLDDDLRLEVAKDYKRKLERDYKTRVQITPSDVDSILQQAHMFRNVCAHEERLYDYKIDRAKSRANIFANYNKIYDKEYVPTMNGSYVFDLLISLCLFLNKHDYIKLVKNMDKLISNYSHSFYTITIDDLYTKMNFPDQTKILDML